MICIRIIPLQVSNQKTWHTLADGISKYLHLPTRIENIEFELSFAYDPSRGQYHSTYLMAGLQRFVENEEEKLLAVTEEDLFIPILTFVFGEAQLDGSISIVSSFRLRPEYYGLPVDENLVNERLLKEAIHELGHTFGLVHCLHFNCVLHGSTYAEEIDLKTADFCRNCQRLLGEKLNRFI